MKKSIKRAIWIRVAAALCAMLIFSVAVNLNIAWIRGAEADSSKTSTLLSTAQMAEVAHYRWSGNLGDTLYAGVAFTGSVDPTACTLGEWIYGTVDTGDSAILSLREELEPLHKRIHESATYVLELVERDPEAAQIYYRENIQTDVSQLVGLLEELVARSEQLQQESTAEVERSILVMQAASIFCFVLALGCLASLVYYVICQVVRPILQITAESREMLEGRLDLQINYHSENELGQLSGALEQSMKTISGYVAELDRMMAEFSKGCFNVSPQVSFQGDFRSIEEAIDSFTTTISQSMSKIDLAAVEVSNSAENISSSAQNMAQGATEQASAVEQLLAALDELSKNAKQTAQTAAGAQQLSRQSGQRVQESNNQMSQMVKAMEDIQSSSQEISKIISTIEDIAFQTNILALNAAVEAARAGSAGKGFAVVADEVRNLASKSDQAAKATKELIETSIETVGRGSQIVDEVSTELRQTLELARQSADQIGVIAESVNGEASSISQVTEGVGQISAVIQNNSATSEESAAVSADLFTQARLLKEQIEQFQLKTAQAETWQEPAVP